MNIGGKCYEKEVEEDLIMKPREVCDVDKRRACDSLYININKKLKRHNMLLEEENLLLKHKMILISDMLYCNQMSNEVKEDILGVIESEKIK